MTHKPHYQQNNEMRQLNKNNQEQKKQQRKCSTKLLFLFFSANSHTAFAFHYIVKSCFFHFARVTGSIQQSLYANGFSLWKKITKPVKIFSTTLVRQQKYIINCIMFQNICFCFIHFVHFFSEKKICDETKRIYIFHFE